MKKVAFYTLGCKLNFSETSTISRMFEGEGYHKVPFEQSPDIFVINTCSVTENADKKCREIVKKAKKIAPGAYVVIIGCFAQLKPTEISEIPGVDAVLGAAEKFNLLEHLKNFEKQKDTIVCASEISNATDFNNAYSISDRTRTFLKVQDGCNYGCAFCTIPLARGKSRSDQVQNIVASAESIGATETKEIVLTGVNIGDFGIQNGKRQEQFIDLLIALDEIDTINRFRISSIEPNLLNSQIIQLVASSQRFVPHFHIPLQSGSNKILKLMNRRYLKELYIDRVKEIKSSMPHACIGVDVIVGFPGERHEDFLETYSFLNGLDISYLHVFSYSERADTKAIAMDGTIPLSERKQRADMLRILSNKKKHYFNTQNLNMVYDVLFENDIKDGIIYGHTPNYIKVGIPGGEELVNKTIAVDLNDVQADLTVRGSRVTELQPE